MNCKKSRWKFLCGVLALSKEVDEAIYPIPNTILKEQKFKTPQNISQKIQIQVKSNQKFNNQVKNRWSKQQISSIKLRIMNLMKRTTQWMNMKKLKIIQSLKYHGDKKIIEIIKCLVHLTALDNRYISCGSNSLHLLVVMKVDMRQYSFENVKIRDTTLVGGNFVRCNFNGSEFDNVYISGMNLSQTQLFNCKWKNIKIHELNKLDGHDGKVNQVCFSSDGKSLASCSDYNLIILWDVKTGKEKSKIRVKENVKSVCFSPNNTIIVFSIGKFVYLWNLKTGKELSKLNGHLNDVNSICFSPNGTKIASGSEDKSICLWDGKTGQQKAKLDGHSSIVYSVNLSPDGTTLASGSYDESIRLWNVKASKKIIQSDSSYKDLLTQIKIPLQKSSLFANVNPDLTILRICQNPQLEAQGTLILQGQFINHQGEDLKSLFKSKEVSFRRLKAK